MYESERHEPESSPERCKHIISTRDYSFSLMSSSSRSTGPLVFFLRGQVNNGRWLSDMPSISLRRVRRFRPPPCRDGVSLRVRRSFNRSVERSMKMILFGGWKL